MCFIFQQSIYIGKDLAELNLVLEAYGRKSCPFRSAPERRNPMEMHLMGMEHFLISGGGWGGSAKKPQANHKAEEVAMAQGSLGESVAPRFAAQQQKCGAGERNGVVPGGAGKQCGRGFPSYEVEEGCQ